MKKRHQADHSSSLTIERSNEILLSCLRFIGSMQTNMGVVNVTIPMQRETLIINSSTNN